MKRIINIIKAKLGLDYDPYEIASKEQKALWQLQGMLFKGCDTDEIYEAMKQYF